MREFLVSAMAQPDPVRAREYATEVVRVLRAAGFEALWAGGCVRDRLMGREPKDYDVATSAMPEQIRSVFGKHRTLPLGAAFGVITVLGPPGAGQVEIATFRCDATYSDGRHPDRVTYSTAERDAQRRDFTINGLFFDPLSEHVIDYVGGCQDLRQRTIRAIGDPHTRIGEDKLRMLRAVRFAATFEFELDDATLAAIEAHAGEITVVSGERIADELRRMLVHRHRRRAVELLHQSKLLPAILPEAESVRTTEEGSSDPSPALWDRMLRILEALDNPTFSAALAVLLREIYLAAMSNASRIEDIARRWRLSNHEASGVIACLACESPLRAATRTPWPRLQRILIAPRIDEVLTYAAAVAQVIDGDTTPIDFCRQKLALPKEELDPAPLVTGEDLKKLGVPPGPIYREILERVRDSQLMRLIETPEAALSLARRIWSERAGS